jgi:hypothetical protein
LVERDYEKGIGIWQRTHEHAPPQRTGIVEVMGGSPHKSHYRGMLELITSGYRVPLQVSGDSLVPRARSIAFSSWWRETADDVVVMIDMDIGFSEEDVERLAWWCPLHDGSAFGVQVLEGEESTQIDFGNDKPPKEIRSVAPGFLAVHRKVFDQLIPQLLLCHPALATSFWPMCMDMIEEITLHSEYGSELAPMHVMLSEDWAFSARCRDIGIKQWMARDIIVQHWGEVPATIRNMALVREAIRRA